MKVLNMFNFHAVFYAVSGNCLYLNLEIYETLRIPAESRLIFFIPSGERISAYFLTIETLMS